MSFREKGLKINTNNAEERLRRAQLDAELEELAAKRLAGEKEELPAREAVELEARTQREEEEKERPPTTPEALIHATLGHSGEGVISELHIQYARNEHAQQILLQLEQRLNRFLLHVNEKDIAEPSLYAKTVFAVATAEQPDPQHLRVLQEFQQYFTAELNPLLHQLYEVVRTTPNSTITSQEAFWDVIKAGEVSNQKTTSLFGVLRRLERHIPDAALTLDQADPVQKIVVVNPVDINYTEYWNTRLNCREIYGKSTIPDLIAMRTGFATYELRTAAEQLANNPDTADTAHAYTTLADWLEEEAQPFQSSDAKQPEHFGFLVRRLHFAQGSVEETTDLLNAAELVKRSNPELYTRLCGIAPRYDHGTSGDTEVGKSDLFGNAFQLALSRSLALNIRSDKTVNTLFHDRIQGLTEIDRPQQLIQHMNADQLATLEKNIRLLQAGVTQGESTTARTTSAVLALMASKHYFEAQLPHMLDAIRAQEFDEERERIAERLRVAAPQEFIALLKKMPHEFTKHAEISELIEQRVFSRAPKTTNYYSKKTEPELIPYTHMFETETGVNKVHERKITTVGELLRGLKVEEDEMKIYSTYDQLVRLLWETAPDETLLSRDFFEYLKENSQTNDSICSILHTHPAITKKQWEQWQATLTKSAAGGIVMLAISSTLDNVTSGVLSEFNQRKIDAVLENIAKQFTPDDILKTDSSFFQLPVIGATVKTEIIKLGRTPRPNQFFDYSEGTDERIFHSTLHEHLPLFLKKIDQEYLLNKIIQQNVSYLLAFNELFQAIPVQKRAQEMGDILITMEWSRTWEKANFETNDWRVVLLNHAERYVNKNVTVARCLDNVETLQSTIGTQRLTRKEHRWFREFWDDANKKWLMNMEDLTNEETRSKIDVQEPPENLTDILHELNKARDGA